MYKLRPYQQDAVNSAIRYFRIKRDPAVLVLPTGAGKSLVIAELAKIAKGRVLVLAHVKELVEQNHAKYISHGLEAGVYSAGLNQKDSSEKVIFGSIQSVANAPDSFYDGFTLVIIDECHRVGMDADSQYGSVITKLKADSPQLCVLGLTATPYRMGMGWIYNYNHQGILQTEEKRFFQHCIYELPLKYMIRNKFLTPPVKIDIPVTSYDFGDLFEEGQSYSEKDLDNLLNSQRHLTPLIIKNVIDIAESYKRQGVMIFASTVQHAMDILELLPKDDARLVIADTSLKERDLIIEDFKQKKFKFLVNVSVLTTGFDAPHVDVIAILRPTESVSLYQQIIGRGLRLNENKEDCFVLDYTGMGHDIYAPEIGDKKPQKESVQVEVNCPKCDFVNVFWGLVDDEGEIIEHYGRKCKGGEYDEESFKLKPCGFRFRFKLCGSCAAENDIAARTCNSCNAELTDAKSRLKQARLSKTAHVMQPDSMEYIEKKDKNGNPYLEIKYYDLDANALSEFHFLNNPTSRKKFHINFLRSHLRLPELPLSPTKPEEVVELKHLLRVPRYIIARKQDKFWRITEKIFSEHIS